MHELEALDLRRNWNEGWRQDSWPDWLGISWRSSGNSWTRNRRDWDCMDRWRKTATMDRNRLRRPEGKHRVQCVKYILGTRTLIPSGPYSSLVALESTTRPRCPSTANHEKRYRSSDRGIKKQTRRIASWRFESHRCNRCSHTILRVVRSVIITPVVGMLRYKVPP